MKTISEKYKKIQSELHFSDKYYGRASIEFSPIVAGIMDHFKIDKISDYGAGKKRLLDALTKLKKSPRLYFPYDPVFPEYGNPKPADLVCCIDVLEHIEPELLDNVLEELKNITTNLGFFTVHLGPSRKILSDGRNAHINIMPMDWWLNKFSERFDIVRVSEHSIMGPGFWVVVKNKINN